jgi:WD40 repeat protein
VGILADGRVVAADARNRLRVIDPGRNVALADLATSSRVRLLRPAPDGFRLLTFSLAARSAPPELWDLERYRSVGTLEGHVGRVLSARFVRNGQAILTSGEDGTARSWDAVAGQLLRTYRGGSQFLTDAALDPSGNFVLAGGGDGLLRFWDAESGSQIWTLQAHRSAVLGINFEGGDIITRAITGDITRWSLPAAALVIEACHRTGACDRIPK